MSTSVPLVGFGGGTSLQFKVIACASANDLPASPKENTIAIIPITAYDGHYEFSAVSPSELRAGKVWIQIAASSPYPFSLTKKNPIWVYPVRCYQYFSGWKDVESYIYQGGKWSSFGTVYLYNAGNECTAFTGGWTCGGPPYSGTVSFVGGVTRTDSHIYISLNSETMGSDANIGETLRCKNKIDLTPYKTLTFKGSFNRYGSSSHAWYSCWTTLGDTYQQNIAAVQKITATNDTDVVLDVSSLSGEHVIGIGVRACGLRLTQCFLNT